MITAVATWTGFVALLYAVGWSVGWVRRGAADFGSTFLMSELQFRAALGAQSLMPRCFHRPKRGIARALRACAVQPILKKAMPLCRLSSVLLLLLTSPSFAQDVTVRVINAGNGRPLANQDVWVRLRSGDHWADDDVRLRLKTDVKGETHFSLPQPALRGIDVGTAMSPSHWGCGLCWDRFALQDILQKGIVAPQAIDYKPTKLEASLKPTPGQILFARRRLSFFEWLYMATIGL
jgi:hypothetical protein